MADEKHMSEHENPNKPDINKPQESPKEKKIIKHVNELLEQAKVYREKYDVDWQENYKFFRGLQWSIDRPDYRHSEVINLIFQNIQSGVPILTDSRPRFEYLPQEPNDVELSLILNKLAESDWQKNNWLMVLTEMLYDSHIYGTALGSMEFNPSGSNGIGAIEFKSRDPFYCFPDPDAWSVNVNSEYFIYAEPMALTKIRNKWEKGKYVTSDVDDTASDKTDITRIKIQSPTENYVAATQDKTSKTSTRKQALVITLYEKDNDFDEIESIDEKTGKKKFTQKKKYPGGRKTVVANGIVLESTENPYDDGKFPYAKLVNYILPREFWGESEVKQLKSPQVIFNKMVSFALDVLTLMGNPIWIVDRTSGVDTDNIYNRPGEIIEKEPGTEVRRQEGTQLQPYVLQLIDRMKLWFDEIGGSNDVSRGATPGGVTAGNAIMALQEASQTRMRQKSRNIDAFLQNMGQMYASRVFQFYSVPRIVRLTNNEKAQEYFRFSIETDEKGAKTAVVKPFKITKGEGGEARALEMPEKRYEVTSEFDVRVSTGSLLPFAKAEKESKLLNFYDRGIIDREEVLKGVDYPSWEGVLQRVQEKEQAAAQQPPA